MATLSVRINDHVVKWDQGKQTAFVAVPMDSCYMRKVVIKDFVLYACIYAFAPLGLLLNRYADYPLRCINFKWILINTILSFAAVMAMVLPFLIENESHITGFERCGAILAFILRCTLTACIEALNIEPSSIRSLHLERFSIETLFETDKPHTANDFYDSIMNLSHFSTALNFRTLFGHKIGICCGAVITTGLISIPMFLRKFHGIGFLGNSIPDRFCVVLSDTIIFGVSFFLLNVFFLGFALYRSMRSSMRRLKNGTLGAWAAEVERQRLKEVGPSSAKKKSRQFPVIKLDVSQPKNLRAWMNVHEALSRRKDDIAARLIELGTTLGLVFFLLMVFAIFLETYQTNYEVMSSSEFVQDVTALGNTSLYVIIYLTCVIGACMCALCLVGNDYNYAAKELQIHNLYAVQLEVSLDLATKENLDTTDRIQYKASKCLLETVQQHLHYHVRDLGILGISYSKLFWGISGLVSSIITRQLLHMIF